MSSCLTWHVQGSGLYTEAGRGRTIQAGSSANTVGVTSTVCASSIIVNDVYGIAIRFQRAFVSGSNRKYLANLFVDPAGGTSWESTPRIANLIVNSVSETQGGQNYYFPLFIKAGSSIGMNVQELAANTTIGVSISLWGEPMNAEAMKVGTVVRTFGATAATSTGTTFTAGSAGAKGAWTQVGTISANDSGLWWWQAGFNFTDTSLTAVTYYIDVAVGNATDKIIVISDAQYVNIGTVEAAGYPQGGGMGIPAYSARAGALVYVRGACSGTPDSSSAAIVYGCGG
jgi:hypothetical protein